jgi:hypothetical protein
MASRATQMSHLLAVIGQLTGVAAIAFGYPRER